MRDVVKYSLFIYGYTFIIALVVVAIIKIISILIKK